MEEEEEVRGMSSRDGGVGGRGEDAKVHDG